MCIVKCAVCGEENYFPLEATRQKISYISRSKHSILYDLDHRPAAHEFIPYLMQECEKCHYANFSIDKLIDKKTVNYVKSTHYQRIIQDNNKLKDVLMENFGFSDPMINLTLSAYLYAAAWKDKEAGEIHLAQAWHYDDFNTEWSEILAKGFRKSALDCFIHNVIRTNDKEVSVIIVDLLRRIGEFTNAYKFAQKVLRSIQTEKSSCPDENERYIAILNFEMYLCEKQDLKCHNESEIN